MRVAIVCDSIGEFGGAERVVLALAEMFPEAPIYTSFTRKGVFLDKLKDRNPTTGSGRKRIVKSWAHYIPFFSTKLHSPLRFLLPWIWGSFNFQDYDLVISSASWYVTKGFGSQGQRTKGKVQRGPVEICYCHTPPRWLYGYDTPMDIKKNLFVRIYVVLIAHFIRVYDFNRAQRVTHFVANSVNVQKRIEKFYRRDSVVIYPPVEMLNAKSQILNGKRDYYLIVSRITGGKGIEMAVAAANKLEVRLKIAGLPAGYSDTYEWVKKNAGLSVELLGFVPDSEIDELYTGAKAFLALERDVDFGMTPVEAQGRGTPVIAYNGGGYPESVTKGQTGILFDEYSVEGLIEAIKRFETLRQAQGDKISENCIKQAKKFSRERFEKEFKELVKSVL